jgi:predicted TPR repeat methyltransferase
MTKYNENFINIRLSEKTVYIYSVRKLLHSVIDKNLKLFYGTLLDLGCGEMPYRQYLLDKNKRIKKYIGMDIDYNQYHQCVNPDMYWDGKSINLDNNSVDTVIATELFEHIPNIEQVLGEICRVLSDKGILFFTVPFIWPLHETPFDEYRYTPYSLKRLLKKAGLKNINIRPLGGYNASLAQMICIWIANNKNDFSLSKKAGFLEKFILYPIIEKLLRRDKQLKLTIFGENTMSPGFYGYAKK